MSGFELSLFKSHEVAHALLVICLAAASGLALGSVRIGGFKLGVAGVLFTGLAFGHLGYSIDARVLEFLRELGLILFVYCIGLQMGPGFFASFRRQGLPLNLLAASIIILGAALAYGIGRWGGVDPMIALGLFSGASTNTPSLAAAQQAVRDFYPALSESVPLTGLGYAVAYPFGVVGTMLSMLVIRRLFRVDAVKEAEEFHLGIERSNPAVTTINLQVKNPNLFGMTIGQIPSLSESGVVISRVMHDGRLQIASAEMALSSGDILHAVGSKERLDQLRVIVGSESPIDLKAVGGGIVSRRVIVTRSIVLGRTIEDLDLTGRHGVTITRVSRAGVEFAASRGFRVEFGDTLVIVGEAEAVERISHEVGNSPQMLRHPQLIPFFVGIAFGVFVGQIPIHVPGFGSTLRLGLAGGPLLAAILFSRLGHVGRLTWYMPMSANFMLRELGIVLFLACVGLKSGGPFVETLSSGSGLTWLLFGAVITAVPLLAVAAVARATLKLNFTSICGLLAGAMTDPPSLAFAGGLVKSDAPSVSYATVYPLVMLLRVLFAQILAVAVFRA